MQCPRCKSQTALKNITDGFSTFCCGHFIYQPESAPTFESTKVEDLGDYSSEPPPKVPPVVRRDTLRCRQYIKANFELIQQKLLAGNSWRQIDLSLAERGACVGNFTLLKYYRAEVINRRVEGKS